MNRCMGYRPDEADARDYRFTSPLGSTPDRVARLPMGEPFDQGPIGSCVAQSVAKAFYCVDLQGWGTPPPVASRLALYYWSRRTHGMAAFDSGTFIRSTFRVINALGYPPEWAWPYVPERFAQKPGLEVERLAYDVRTESGLIHYRRIFDEGAERVHALKSALALGYPVVVGMRIDDAFIRRDDDIWPGVTGPIVGGHAVVLGSYDENGPEFLNSWGNWSTDGWNRMTWEATSWLEDIWVVISTPATEAVAA